MKHTLIILLIAIIVMSCESSYQDEIDITNQIAKNMYQIGYKQGSINVLENGTYNETQWKLDSIEAFKTWE